MTEFSVDAPLMPGRNGGLLRRGGGRPPVSKAQTEALSFLKAHAVDAAKALLEKAMKGDVRAAELILAYAVGKPTDKLELTGADGGPVRFLDGLDDHERATLKAAIDAELGRRRAADREARGAKEAVLVAGTPSSESGTT